MRIVIGEVEVSEDGTFKMKHGVDLNVDEKDLSLPPDQFSAQFLYPAIAQLVEWQLEKAAN